MKTILKTLKTTLSGNTTLNYVKKFTIVSPKLLPEIPNTQVPFIGLAPTSTSETWVAQRKQATHQVDLYIVNYMQLQENAIIGDTVKQGLLDVVSDVSSIVRGERLLIDGNYYLSKPIEITRIDYDTAPYGDSFYLIVATLSLQCIRLFNITLP